MMIIKAKGAHVEFRLEKFCVIAAVIFVVCYIKKLGKSCILANLGYFYV